MENPNAETKPAGSNELSEADFKSELASLSKRWSTHLRRGLEIRHDTGKLLNRRYGPPTQRQERGKQVLKEVGERLKLPASELSRMRWFAHHFKTLNDLRDKRPFATNWTAVKMLLPTLMQGCKEAEQRATDVASSARSRQLRGLSQSLGNLSSRLSKLTAELTPDEKKELLAKFEEVAQAFQKCLKTEETAGQVSEEEAPPAACEEASEEEEDLLLQYSV